MDKSLQKLEADLENLIPRGLSDQGKHQCEQLIDRLAEQDKVDSAEIVPLSSTSLSWKSSAAAAAVILGVGLGSGWYLGNYVNDSNATPVVVEPEIQSGIFGGDLITTVPAQDGKGKTIVINGTTENGDDEINVKSRTGENITLRFSEAQ